MEGWLLERYKKKSSVAKGHSVNGHLLNAVDSASEIPQDPFPQQPQDRKHGCVLFHVIYLQYHLPDTEPYRQNQAA